MNTYLVYVIRDDTITTEERCEWCDQPIDAHGPELDDEGDPVCPVPDKHTPGS
jgi:hypothetical protein